MAMGILEAHREQLMSISAPDRILKVGCMLTRRAFATTAACALNGFLSSFAISQYLQDLTMRIDVHEAVRQAQEGAFALFIRSQPS